MDEQQSPDDKQSKKKWRAWSLEQETQFGRQIEKVSTFDTFKDEATNNYDVHNDFEDIRSKAFKVRRKVYEQVNKQRETTNFIQIECNNNMVQSLKPESTDVANKSVDDKTKKFSTVTKRIQKDRHHCNYDGNFENHIKNDAKEKNTTSLCATFKRFFKNFKAHRYKECTLDGNTKQNETKNSVSLSKSSLFSFRKRRKKKSFSDYLENKSTAIFTLDSTEINIERKINYIDICNSECSTDNNRLSEGFYNEKLYSDKAIKNWNKLEDENNRGDKTTVNFYGHRNTDLTRNITYYTDLTVDQHEKNNKDLDENKNSNKEYCKKSRFNTSLCYFFQSFVHHLGSKNKIASNSDRRNQTYMIMNFEKSDFKSHFNMKPTTLNSVSAKLAYSHIKEIQQLRNYRLASYLAECDWRVNYFEYRNCLRTGLQKLFSISECEISVPCLVRFYTFN